MRGSCINSVCVCSVKCSAQGLAPISKSTTSLHKGPGPPALPYQPRLSEFLKKQAGSWHRQGRQATWIPPVGPGSRPTSAHLGVRNGACLQGLMDGSESTESTLGGGGPWGQQPHPMSRNSAAKMSRGWSDFGLLHVSTFNQPQEQNGLRAAFRQMGFGGTPDPADL